MISGMLENRSPLTVYFDCRRAAVSNDLGAASASLKVYLDARPDSRVAVSGYNDLSGNAAPNADLSNYRAPAVARAFLAAGIPQAPIGLVKPDEATTTSALTIRRDVSRSALARPKANVAAPATACEHIILEVNAC
ncbi:MAG: hypothetical protein EOP17_00925 [Rhizobiaceae bacterium]|nr:MAG: hypothetical protein EOP17_00925 [Rhizobiaceae bacterium]